MPAHKTGPNAARCTDEEFIRLFQTHTGSEVARILDQNERGVYSRRDRLEKRLGIVITPPSKHRPSYPGRIYHDLRDGTILIGSDAHIWPGKPSTCLRAFKKFVEDIKPDVIVLNGDVMDLPRISRHPQKWESAPDPQEELECVQDHLSDIVQRASRKSRKIWTLGNHDERWELLFASQTPQMKGVKGVHLSDFFPAWEKAMSCMVNEGNPASATMIKHKPPGGGINAPRAFTINGGVSTVNGHLHRANVQQFSDYNRYDRYGVDTGFMADKEHDAFSYTQDSPKDWRSAFGLLTIKGGRLMMPELIKKWDEDHVEFRGSIIKV